MRNRFADVFYKLASRDKRLCMFVADISPAGSMADFRRDFANRFVNVGVAEQSMIGLAAGAAQRGMKPFCYTIASFALYRPFEFIRNDLAYQNLPVTIVGIGGGLLYSTLGATHHTMEDIAVASAIPNMTVLAPCDPAELEECVHWCASRESGGPVYLRLGKAGENILTYNALSWEFGNLRWVSRYPTMSYTCYLCYGHGATQLALKMASRDDNHVAVVHTLKPLDTQGVLDVLREYRQVVVVEEAVVSGGLGQQVRAIAQQFSRTNEIITYNLKDEFGHVYGSHSDLLRHHEWPEL